MLRDLTPQQRALADRMSEISEEAFCAGWMRDLEYDLWRIVVAGGGTYGWRDLDRETVEELRSLSAACDGWIVFDDETEETFLPIQDWIQRCVLRSSP